MLSESSTFFSAAESDDDDDDAPVDLGDEASVTEMSRFSGVEIQAMALSDTPLQPAAVHLTVTKVTQGSRSRLQRAKTLTGKTLTPLGR